MDENGRWCVSYDLTFSPGSAGEHCNGHREGEKSWYATFLKPAVVTSIDKQKALLIIEQVTESVSRWKIFAKTAKSCDDI
jgi:hypothetical protein